MRASLSRVALLVVALAGLTIGTLACGKQEEDLPSETVTPHPSPSASEPTAGIPGTATPPALETAIPTPASERRTFTNTKYGFSFEYPANWFIDPLDLRDEATSDYIDLYNFLPSHAPQTDFPPPLGATEGKIRIEFYIGPNADKLSLEDWVGKFNANPDSPDSVVASETIEINGLSAIMQTVTNAAGESPQHLAFVDLGEWMLFVNGPRADSPFVSTYQQIVASLRRA